VHGVNDAPVVSGIPGETIDEDNAFALINLDDYVEDLDNPDSEITWNATGQTDLTVNIVDRVATIQILDEDWYGSEVITFTATDPGLLSDSGVATFTVNAVNDAPQVSGIPGQTIDEGDTFTQINLDDYVADPDNLDSELTWNATGQTDLTVNIVDRIATITTPDGDWYGSEVITFTATDPGLLPGSGITTFTVNGVNDAPVVSGIPSETIDEGGTFVLINLDDYVEDLDNLDSELTWNATGQTDLTVNIVDRVATITTPDGDWYGSEVITFTATDPGLLSDSAVATFTVNAVNDAPQVSGIPGQTIDEGDTFVLINLDDYVVDPDNLDSELTWNATGQTDLMVNIVDRVATIQIPDEDWYGSEVITFTATDPGLLPGSGVTTFTVNAVNDAPVVSGVPGETIDEGGTFVLINLDDCVEDLDNLDSEITWNATGQTDLTVNIVDRIAAITTPDGDWYGSEVITFTATDPGLLSDSGVATFTVNALPDFEFDPASSPYSRAIEQGQSTDYTVSLTAIAEYNSQVTLSINGISPYPGNENPIQCSFSSNPVIPDDPAVTSALNISTAQSVFPGTYVIDIKGTDGTKTRYTSVEVVVNQSPLNGSISGMVYEEGTTNPLDGVRVQSKEQFGSWQDRNWDDTETGYYIIEGLMPGTYYVYAKKAGYGTALKTDMQVNAGQNTPIEDMYMTNNPGWIYGTVTASGVGPLENVKVEVYIQKENGNTFWINTYDQTDAAGAYELHDLAPGDSYVVRANGITIGTTDYATAIEHNVNVQNGLGTEVNFVTGEAARIYGIVKDTEENPIGGVSVNCWIEGINAGSAWDTSDEVTGEYELRYVLPGHTYIIGAYPPSDTDYLSMHYDMDIPSSGDYLYDIILQKGTASLSGTIFDYTTGVPVGGIDVVLDNDTYRIHKYTVSDDAEGPTKGTFSFSKLPDNGVLELHAEPDPDTGYASSSRDLYQETNDMTGMDLYLKEGALIQGRVTVAGTGSHPNDICIDAIGGHFAEPSADTEYSDEFSGDGYYEMRFAPGTYTIGVDFSDGNISWPEALTVSDAGESHTVDLTIYSIPDDCVTISGNITINAAAHEDSSFMITAMPAGLSDSLVPGSAIPDAVSMYGYDGVSSTYTLHVIPEREYDLVFGLYNEREEVLESFAIIDIAENVVVGSANINGPDFTFDSPGGEITGTVTAKGEPLLMVYGGTVSIFDASGQFAGFANSGQNGVYHIYNVPEGDYVAYADQRDHSLSPGFDAYGVTNGGTVTRDIELYERYLKITSPQNGQTLEGDIAVQAESTDAPGYKMSAMTLYVDGERYAFDNTQPFEFNWPTRYYADASVHTLKVGATFFRPYQRIESDEITVTVENPNPITVPTLEVVDPGSTLSGTVTIDVTGEDHENFTFIQLYCDDALIGYDYGAPYQISWDTTKVTEGTHQLKARGYHKYLKQYMESAPLEVEVQNTVSDPYSVTITNLTEGETVSGDTTVEVIAAPSDKAWFVTFFVDGWARGYDFLAPYRLTWRTEDFENGPHTIRALCRYRGSRTTSEHTITVNVDN